MTRQFLPFFDPSRPVFVKQQAQLSGKVRKVGELYDWRFFEDSYQTIQSLFGSDILHHNPELEEEKSYEVSSKDLEEMNIAELHIYIDNLNAKLKPKLKTAKEFAEKKCAKVPKDCATQVRRIKNWRLTYGHLLD